MYTNGISFSVETVSFLQDKRKDSLIVDMILTCSAYYADTRFNDFQEIICKLEDIKGNPTMFDVERKHRDSVLAYVEEVQNGPTPTGFDDPSGSAHYVDDFF